MRTTADLHSFGALFLAVLLTLFCTALPQVPPGYNTEVPESSITPGKESNWLPTDPKRRFFLLARFYGPEPALFDGSFELNNIELVE